MGPPSTQGKNPRYDLLPVQYTKLTPHLNGKSYSKDLFMFFFSKAKEREEEGGSEEEEDEDDLYCVPARRARTRVRTRSVPRRIRAVSLEI